MALDFLRRLVPPNVAAQAERFITRPFLHMMPSDFHPVGHAQLLLDLRRVFLLQKDGGFRDAQGCAMGG